MVEAKVENKNRIKELLAPILDTIVSHESYGNFVDFYDEDGVVVLTMERDEVHNKTILSFINENISATINSVL